MFVLLKRKEVGERGRELGRGGGSGGERKGVAKRGWKWRREEGSWGEGVEEVHEKERAELHGVDVWTNYQATDLDIIIGKGKWKDYGAPSITKLFTVL